MSSKSQLKSSWTPLSNEEANQKMYQERRALVGKWFEKWTDGQRKQVILDLMSQCKVKQLEFAGDVINKRRPVHHDDFTRHLPRVLSLYIFSFLDPRSLCRCSRVCWHWKYITEVDQLWMPKCIKLGWILPFSPNIYEVGTWKRLYIENVSELNCPRIKESFLANLEKMSVSERNKNRKTPRPRSGKPPPWRGSDPEPKDTWRNNYLDNADEVTRVNRLRKKGKYGPESEEITNRATKKVNTGHAAKRSSSLPRSKSSLGIYTSPGERPDWAKPQEGAFDVMTSRSIMDTPKPVIMHQTDKNKTVTLKNKTNHNNKGLQPSTDLFPEKPWTVQNTNGYDSD